MPPGLSAPTRHAAPRVTTRSGIGHAHLVGIGGAGMQALATVLSEAGWRISGSDIAATVPARLGWKTHSGHAIEHLLPPPDIVVHSPAIARDNLELAVARRLGIPVVSYPQAVGHLMNDRTGIAVAGTHGKSTTVAMTASILLAAGLDPTVIAGADLRCGRPLNRHGKGPWMVVEACEYRSSFLHLRPRIAAILGIEPDHFDYFTSTADLEHAFGRFAALVPRDGVLIGRDECPATRRATASGTAGVETMGVSNDAHWRARSIADDRGRYHFELLKGGRSRGKIRLQIAGRHNVLNALAAAALAHHAGAAWCDIREGLAGFQGLRRRLETLGVAGGLTIIDDYAHHPTEIAAALKTVRELHPGQKIYCVFEPHQASRTKSLLDELASSLHNADTLVVAEIFRAREPDWQPGEITAADLAARARHLGSHVAPIHDQNDIEDWLVDSWRQGSLDSGDVLVTLGAGHIGRLANGVYDRIRKSAAAERAAGSAHVV